MSERGSREPPGDPFHCWASLPGCEKRGMWPVLASLGVRKEGMWPVLASLDGERRGNVARSSLPGWVKRGGMWPVLASLDGRYEGECGPF